MSAPGNTELVLVSDGGLRDEAFMHQKERTEQELRSRIAADPKKQQELIVKLQELVYQDVPCHKYGEYFGLRARSTKLQGTINPPDPFMWNAWLS